MAYLLYLPLLDGDGGQAAVFYNLLMALGALEVIRAGEDGDAAGIWRHGVRSMICVGFAIQVKYTAAVEGVGFGLWLIWLTMQRQRITVWQTAPSALLWAMTALAPTLVVTAFYILIGHGSEFIQANFLSIFQRHQPEGFSPLTFLVPSMEKLAPLVFLTVYSGVKLQRENERKNRRARFWCYGRHLPSLAPARSELFMINTPCRCWCRQRSSGHRSWPTQSLARWR